MAARTVRVAASRRAQRAALALLAVLPAVALVVAPPAQATPQACQVAIERIGYRYAKKVLRRVKTCAQGGNATSISTCLDSPESEAPLAALRARWSSETAAPCAGTDLASHLGYFSTCAAPPSACTFEAPALDAAGPSNDRLDCLACRIRESLAAAGSRLFDDQPAVNECHETIGKGGLAVLQRLVRRLKGCQSALRESIAACLATPAIESEVDDLLAGWRDASVTGCGGTDPIAGAPGYPMLCSGMAPAQPASCPETAPACTFSAAAKLDAAGEPNDLLDCLGCQLREAALEVGRELYGANLCCVGDDCGVVRTRRACRRDGGEPAFYRIATLADADMSGPHGVAVDAGGTVYVADTGGSRIKKITAQGQASVLANLPDLPFGVAVDSATGTVLANLRCGHQVLKITPGGNVSTFAGTGLAGHSGDGGPATSAKLVAPNRATFDGAGNVFITESGFLSFICPETQVVGERIRMVSSDGTISTVAGSEIFGTMGEGGPALGARMGIPYAVTVDADGRLVIGEAGTHRVLRLGAQDDLLRVAGEPMVVFGTYFGDGGRASEARFYEACGVSTGLAGEVFVADMMTNRIRMIDREGSIISIAGNGLAYQTLGDGKPAPFADAGCPEDVAVGPDGRVYFASPRLAVRLRRLLRPRPGRGRPRRRHHVGRPGRDDDAARLRAHVQRGPHRGGDPDGPQAAAPVQAPAAALSAPATAASSGSARRSPPTSRCSAAASAR